MSKRKQPVSSTIAFAEFCKPASVKTEPNPPEHDIDAYERLSSATLSELSRLIPRWNIRTGDGACKCEYLVLRSADHPNAVMIAAGRRLAERLGIPEEMVSWQCLS